MCEGYGLGFGMPWRVTGASPSHPEIRRHVCSWCKVKGWQQCTLYTPSVIAFSIKNVATSRPNPENCGSRSTCQRKASTVMSQVCQPLAGITWHVNAYANNNNSRCEKQRVGSSPYIKCSSRATVNRAS